MDSLPLRVQVDENMKRAQKRDAAVSSKFYFRKDVLPSGGFTPPSSDASSVSSFPCGGNGQQKETKLRNCFEPLAFPEDGLNHGCVHDEYEEMCMNQIINGKVRSL